MLHFTTRGEWEAGVAAGAYEPDAMADDGFVPLSFGHQLARVAAKVAAPTADLVLLVIDNRGLEDDLRVENGAPHLYRPVPVSSVRLVVDFTPDADGRLVVPERARLAELELTAQPSFDDVLSRCRSVMAGFAGPWWIGGGWAADAGTGRVSRPHLDLDVVALRRDAVDLGDHFAGWDLRIPRTGTLASWDGQDLAEEDHQFWIRPDDGHRPDRWQDFALDPGFFEVLFETDDPDSGEWTFRRDPGVRAPLDRLGPCTGFLRPEVALLYKAAAAAGTDPAGAAKAQGDFDSAVSGLDAEQRAWLAGSLQLAHPGHPWITTLSG